MVYFISIMGNTTVTTESVLLFTNISDKTIFFSTLDEEFWSLENSLIICAYSLLILLSLFGNLLVCNVILFKRSMRRRTTNMFIANLTISDLLLTIFAIPLFVVRVILDNWPFGDILCKLLPMANSISVYVSVLSMTAIAIDRYQVLMRPLKQHTRSTKIPKLLILLLIWVIAVLLSLPNAFYNKVVISQFDRITLSRCRVEYPIGEEKFYNKITTCATVFGQYLIPLTIVASCYTIIGMKISKRTFIGAATPAQWQIHSCAKRRTIKMLVLVVVIFAICWAPYNTVHVLQDFFDIKPNFRTLICTHWFAMSSICYNPFIYFWLSPGYRDGFRYFLALFGIKIGTRQSSPKRRNASRLHRMESGNTVCEMTTNNIFNLLRTPNGHSHQINDNGSALSKKHIDASLAISSESIEFKVKCSKKFNHHKKRKSLFHETEIECLTVDGHDGGEIALL